MRFSVLNEIPTSKKVVDAFRGYNHNLRIGDGEFYSMQNLTSDDYPVLSPRCKRGTYEFASSGTHNPNGLIAKDSLCYVDGTFLYINGYKINNFTLSDSPKQLISMGAYIIIMPDKKYINTLDYTDCGDINRSYSALQSVKFELCKEDGELYENITVSSEAPSNPENAQLWIDTSSEPHILKQYSSQSSVWTDIPTTYVRITASDIAINFNQYDGVKIGGIASTITELKQLNEKTSVIYNVHHNTQFPGQDYIVVQGFLTTTQTQTGGFHVSRKMPDMDFVVESGNRLWGCRYGLSDGKIVNEIYASKLGDFKNWNCFMGISTDSYVASCGTDGQFTGAITHLGYPIFFKEDCMHKVYGNYPSQYQIQTTACRGVQKGCGRSLAIVNEMLYYKSRNGVCVYDGSLPVEISNAFGNITYSGIDSSISDTLRNGAVAGSHKNKYYLSAKSEIDDKWYLLVYDTLAQMWHVEDNTRSDAFCSVRNELYYIDHNNKTIRTVFGSGTVDEKDTEWFAETGIIGIDKPNKKYISNIQIRLSTEIGARVSFYISYDTSDAWEHVSTITGISLRSFSTTIKPHRCDHFRLKICGKGNAKIYSITKKIEQGSDV